MTANLPPPAIGIRFADDPPPPTRAVLFDVSTSPRVTVAWNAIPVSGWSALALDRPAPPFRRLTRAEARAVLSRRRPARPLPEAGL